MEAADVKKRGRDSVCVGCPTFALSKKVILDTAIRKGMQMNETAEGRQARSDFASLYCIPYRTKRHRNDPGCLINLRDRNGTYSI